MEKKDYKNYFLGLMSAEDVETLELQIISNDEVEAELLQAENSLIEDYLDGNLTNKEITAFNVNFLVTKERWERVGFVQIITCYTENLATTSATIKETKPNFFEQLKSSLSPRKFVLGFGGVALILTIGFISYLGWKNYSSSSSNSEISVLLNKTFKNDRPTEARITGFDYAPKTEGTRGNGDKIQDLNFVSAKSRAVEAVLKNETAENLHELGRVYLAEKNFDEAVKQFEKAIKQNPNLAKLYNDLGVALMEKGKQKEEGKLELFAKANEEIEKSIELDKTLTEAYFNRGLVIESLNLPNQAKEAWENYLKLDSSSQWADEARKHLQKLEINKPVSKTKEKILQDFLEAKQNNDHEKAWQIYSSNREMVTGKLIPQQLSFIYVEAKLGNDEEKSQKYLNALKFIGDLEDEKTKDLYWKNIADFYSQTKDFVNLQKAQKLVFDGYNLYLNGKYETAQNNFSLAKSIFLKSENIWESKICDYWTATLLYRIQEIEKSTKIFMELANFAEGRNYKWLTSQAYYKIATNVASIYQLSKQIEYGKKALKIADEIQDIYQLQKINSLIADQYKEFRRYEISLQFAEKSLSLSINFDTSLRQKWRNYNGIAGIFFSMKSYHTSALYQTEALKLAKSLEDKTFLHLSNLDLASILKSQKKYDKATKYIKESQNIAESIENQDERKRAISYSKLKLADLKSQLKEYEEAIELYNQTISFYDTSELKFDNYQAHKGRLLCYLAKKDNGYIQQEVPLVLDIFKKYRREILEEQNRNGFFDNEQNIYDLLIDYEHGQNSSEKAFDYAEESRSRSLLDIIKSGAEVSDKDIKFVSEISEPLKLAEIRLQMPEEVQIVQYAVLENKVLIWLIDKENFSVAVSEISSEKLQEKVSVYIEALKKGIAEEQVFSEELYQILISPVETKLNTSKEICLILDKSLFQLPFVALISPRTKKYLLNDYKILFAPSANVFIASTKNAMERERDSDEILLSIGNPNFDQAKFPDLPNLPSAEKEAKEITKYYQAKTVLIGRDASKQKIRDVLPKAHIIHFAGHYVIDENSPMLSNLILSDEDNLANYELIGERLLLAKLIVLSACQTGVERFYKGEGMIGASRTFLAVGVPLVVASQWAVDSEATETIMTNFHRYRKTEKLSSVEALRKSQMDMINNQNETYRQPYYWAAFVTLGGYAKF
jgi:CHAT domain-containing protein